MTTKRSCRDQETTRSNNNKKSSYGYETVARAGVEQRSAFSISKWTLYIFHVHLNVKGKSITISAPHFSIDCSTTAYLKPSVRGGSGRNLTESFRFSLLPNEFDWTEGFDNNRSHKNPRDQINFHLMKHMQHCSWLGKWQEVPSLRNPLFSTDNTEEKLCVTFSFLQSCVH